MNTNNYCDDRCMEQ